MRYDRLHLLAASSLLVIVNACAPNAAVNSLAEVSSVPSRTDVGMIEIDQPNSFNLPEPGNTDLAYRSAWTVDGHFGMWFNEWSGVSLDGPFFQADDNGFNRNVGSATPLLLLRVQMFKSGSVPNGQLQPYVGIGPGIFFTNQEMAFQRDSGSKLDAAHISIGLDLRAGMRWRISNKLGFFGEYRMTRYNGNRDNQDKATFDFREDGDAPLTTNKLIAGLKLTF